ncbi:MAG: hotdog domain-containing protein [Promethearchaeota archaeon]
MIFIKQNTHLQINNKFSGDIIKLKQDFSKVKLQTTSEMRVDKMGLIHGGFIFCLADFAAMVAINHPNVVLGGANVKFLKPVKVGDVLTAEAQVSNIEGKKSVVHVNINRLDDIVFSGEFICFTPENYILGDG